MEETRQAQIYGVRPSHSFEQAAAKFVLENQHKRSHRRRREPAQRAHAVARVTPLHKIHRGTLQPWIDRKRRSGAAVGTINHGLQIVRRILNLAASEWVDEQGLTWLHAAPKIKLLPEYAKAPAVSSELGRADATVPRTARPSCRYGALCRQHGLQRSGNLQPALGVGGGGSRAWDLRLHHSRGSREERRGPARRAQPDRAVRLSTAGGARIQRMSSRSEATPIGYMLNTGWRDAREKAGLPHVRVHDLKHTFGRRLRAAGVSFEDRQDLLGHRSGQDHDALFGGRALSADRVRQSRVRS